MTIFVLLINGKMKQKMKVIILTQNEIQRAMKKKVFKSKKTYTRKSKNSTQWK